MALEGKAAALEALEQSPPPAPTDPALSWRQAVTLRENLAALRERATDSWRTDEYRALLRVESWWTGI